MSTTTANSSNGTTAGGMLHVDESSMRTNKVEQVSSLLISVAVMLALAVAMLFLLFLLSMNWKRQEKMELEGCLLYTYYAAGMAGGSSRLSSGPYKKQQKSKTTIV